MNQLTDGWLPSANGLLRASTYLWLSAPFLQPLYLRSGVAGSQVLFLGFWGAFGAFLGVGRSRSVRISLPRTSCMGESSDVPLDIAVAFLLCPALAFAFCGVGF